MNKDEATKHAKRCIPILRRIAIKNVGQCGYPPRPTSTARLMDLLGIEVEWRTRSNVKAALTRALNEAVELGLVIKTKYNETGWTYIGPEVKAAVEAFRNQERAEVKEMKAHLRTLGLPRSAADNIRDGGVHVSNRAIRIASKRVRNRLGLKT